MAAALAVSGLHAQYRDLGEVSVTAESWSPSALSPGGSVVVVTAAEIEESGASNAAEALESVAGFHSTDYGYPGSVRAPSLRGAASSQVLVIVDGVRRNDARSGNVDLSDIPAQSIERIEVLKGGASSLYGADAVGGVIVITTKHGGDRAATITAENRAYIAALESGAEYLAASQRLGASADTRFGAAGLTIAVSLERSGDSFPALDTDGSIVVRENADYLGGAASLGLEAPVMGGIFSSSLSGRYADLGVPGTVSAPSPNARQGNRDLRGSAAWSSDALAEGRLILDASTFGVWSRMDYENPDSATDSRHDTRSAGADLRFRALVSDVLEVPAGFEVRYDGARSSDIGNRSRIHVGAYAAPVFTLHRVLKISPSVRYDWYDDYTAGFTYALGVSGALSDSVTLKAAGGRSYRAPAFNDLYWPADPWSEGNPNLLPESSWYAEAGGEVELGVVSASLYAHARYTEDLIAWGDPDEDGIWRPENLSAAAFFGADAAVSADIGAIDLTASYSLLLSYDLAGGQSLADDVRVANVPVHFIKLEPSLAAGSAVLRLRASWRSERYQSPITTLDPVLLLGGRAEFKAADKVDVYLDGENLLNAAYTEMPGYPMPGITLKAGVRVTLD